LLPDLPGIYVFHLRDDLAVALNPCRFSDRRAQITGISLLSAPPRPVAMRQFIFVFSGR
jgi:hypothetical protein